MVRGKGEKVRRRNLVGGYAMMGKGNGGRGRWEARRDREYWLYVYGDTVRRVCGEGGK